MIHRTHQGLNNNMILNSLIKDIFDITVKQETRNSIRFDIANSIYSPTENNNAPIRKCLEHVVGFRYSNDIWNIITAVV